MKKGMVFRKSSKKVDSDKAGDSESVRAAAITLLAKRDFASGELRQKLTAKGYDAAVVGETIAELVESRALNDARFAENFVTYHANRGQGPVRIASDLKNLGLASDLIHEALGAGPDWRVLARDTRIRRFGAATPEEWSEKSRQARFLQYRGFSSDHIRSALGPDFNPDE